MEKELITEIRDKMISIKFESYSTVGVINDALNRNDMFQLDEYIEKQVKIISWAIWKLRKQIEEQQNNQQIDQKPIDQSIYTSE